MNDNMKAEITIDEYQKKAISLAIYPTKYETIYPTLGLSGETGEVVEKLIPFLEGNNTPEMNDDILLEIGDVMWYMATIANDINMKLSDCIYIALGDHFDSFKDAQDKSVSIEVYSQRLDIIYPSFMLFARIGLISELVKKYIRDDNQVMSEIRKNKIANGIGEVFKYISCLAFDLSFEIQHAADENLKKLFSRQKRNKLNGNGDNR